MPGPASVPRGSMKPESMSPTMCGCWSAASIRTSLRNPVDPEAGGELRADHLDRDLPVVPQIPRQIDAGHATTPRAPARLRIDRPVSPAGGPGGRSVPMPMSRALSCYPSRSSERITHVRRPTSCAPNNCRSINLSYPGRSEHAGGAHSGCSGIPDPERAGSAAGGSGAAGRNREKRDFHPPHQPFPGRGPPRAGAQFLGQFIRDVPEDPGMVR